MSPKGENSVNDDSSPNAVTFVGTECPRSERQFYPNLERNITPVLLIWTLDFLKCYNRIRLWVVSSVGRATDS